MARDEVYPLDSYDITVNHIQNPVAVNSQPVIPPSVESSSGKRVFG